MTKLTTLTGQILGRRFRLWFWRRKYMWYWGLGQFLVDCNEEVRK